MRREFLRGEPDKCRQRAECQHLAFSRDFRRLSRFADPLLASGKVCYNAAMAKITKTDDLSKVLDAEQPNLVYIVDADGKTTHVVLPHDVYRELRREELREKLEVAFQESDRGESEPWDVEQMKADGRDRFEKRSRQS